MGGIGTDKRNLTFQPQMVLPLRQEASGDLVQLSLPAGKTIPNRVSARQQTLLVIDGRIEVVTDNQPMQLGTKDIVSIPANVTHSLHALESTIMLVIGWPSSTPLQTVTPMKEHTNAYTHPEILEQIAPEIRILVEDHIELCKVLERLPHHFEQKPYTLLLELVGHELNEHFVYEEEILFPRVAPYVGGSDVGPVPKLIKEHRQIRELYDKCRDIINRGLAQQAAVESLENVMQQLTFVLLGHIDKEDTHLFTMMTRLLSEEDKAYIASEIKKRQIVSTAKNN